MMLAIVVGVAAWMLLGPTGPSCLSTAVGCYR